MDKPCRCLLPQGEELYRSVMEYVDSIPLAERVLDEEYERRLGICKTCRHLSNGMCALCGCFVEVRAAKLNQGCADNLW